MFSQEKTEKHEIFAKDCLRMFLCFLSLLSDNSLCSHLGAIGHISVSEQVEPSECDSSDSSRRPGQKHPAALGQTRNSVLHTGWYVFQAGYLACSGRQTDAYGHICPLTNVSKHVQID